VVTNGDRLEVTKFWNSFQKVVAEYEIDDRIVAFIAVRKGSDL
jgi:hypothetical protein